MFAVAGERLLTSVVQQRIFFVRERFCVHSRKRIETSWSVPNMVVAIHTETLPEF